MFKEVLLAVDLHHESSWKKALPVAIEYVRSSGGTLHLLNVIPDYGMAIVDQYFPEDYKKELEEKALAALEAFEKDHLPDDIQYGSIVAEGTVYNEIIEMAKEINADVIVVASGHDGIKDYLIGHNASRVVRHAPCSVIVVR
ncbi:universal stress protein [Solemya velum gill symbiont]|uniref:universal stress protein n=1 Tax=Solemya velum gill symbiont TaxID=2340 RepID=UPI000996613A|nr:universal stress protein [Solemya velum gill symbiont]OOY98508.1 universal stress protein UspA [Solemya velum gill symbiont]OOZ00814.1 universal stress protein UspA [Solemya velum gill symbiont]OOZ02989.1 universal stress protein UspA [Solemya velum gill symbiont]OOZ05240.1 universal stress protein UspA [Solemya velum gill symbiont]OOZ07477.1 universal stress protein UspA [Solemya velum gill symbiont]